MPPDFRTPQSRLDYLHFFTNWVHGSSGRFQPITMPEDLAIRLKPGATLPDALDVFPPRPVPQDAGEAVDGVWIYEMTMLYGDGLFRAKMALEASGTMEMLDDAAVAADLPVVRESMQAFLLVSNVEEDVG